MSNDGSSQATQESDEESNQQAQQSQEQGRATAEWVALAVSLAIILAFVGLAISQSLTGGLRPVNLEVVPQLDEVREVGGVYHLPVEVTNTGEETAENVQVTLTLQTSDEQPETAGFQFHFLAGGETQAAVAIFHVNPVEAGVTVKPVSYQVAAGELGS